MSFATQQMRDALKNHVLEEVLPATGDFRSFYMKEPGQGRMMSTLFVFTPEGIVIMGDLCPKRNGCISDFNYHLGWFARQQSEYYLCSKFLQTEYQTEVAARFVREHIEEMKKDGSEPQENIPKWEELLSSLEGGEMGADHFHDALQDLDYEHEDEGYEYHLQTAGWLCALQQRFAELFQKMYPPQPEPAEAKSASDLHPDKKGE